MDGYDFLKDWPQSRLSAHFISVFKSSGNQEEEFKSGLFSLDGWVRNVLTHIYGDDDDGKDSSLKQQTLIKKYKDAYRFLRNPTLRSQYNNFVERLPVVEKGYRLYRGMTGRSIIRYVIDPKCRDSSSNNELGKTEGYYVLFGSAGGTIVSINADNLDIKFSVPTEDGVLGWETIIDYDWSGSFTLNQTFAGLNEVFKGVPKVTVEKHKDTVRVVKGGEGSGIEEIAVKLKLDATVSPGTSDDPETTEDEGTDANGQVSVDTKAEGGGQASKDEIVLCGFEKQPKIDKNFFVATDWLKGVGDTKYEMPLSATSFSPISDDPDNLPFLLRALRKPGSGFFPEELVYPYHYDTLCIYLFGKSCTDKVKAEERKAHCTVCTVTGGKNERTCNPYECQLPGAKTKEECKFAYTSDDGIELEIMCLDEGNNESVDGEIKKVYFHPGFADFLQGTHTHPRGQAAAMAGLREIYEATLLAHIELVGSEDEYSDGGFTQVHPKAGKYRNDTLRGRERRSDAFYAWKMVRDATLDKFRDGTMSAYALKRVDGTVDISVLEYLGQKSCYRDTTGDFGRYAKLTCVLGTVFQDDAVFIVSRKYGDSSKPLVVDLACGHVEDSKSSFALVDNDPDVRHVPVILESGVNEVTVNVPPTLSFFDLGGEDQLGNYMRCEITRVVIDKYIVDAADEDAFVGFVEVSRSPANGSTFAAVVEKAMDKHDVPFGEESVNRVGIIKDAIMYTYLWGHYAGFIRMPRSSIRDLISSPLVGLVGGEVEALRVIEKNEYDLQQYRLLSSLFSFPGDDRFDTENFGFLIPEEARDEYSRRYDKRFEQHQGVALGNFLFKVPELYR